MDTSSEKTNNDIATQPTAQEKQVPHIAAPAEQAPDEQMGWEVASRRQRGREAVEAASPNSQPARKDMRTQQYEGPLTASAASDKQKQTTPPPRGSAAGQPAATQRSGQKPQQTSTKKNGKEPAAGTGAGAPPQGRCHLQHRLSQQYRRGHAKRTAMWKWKKRTEAGSRRCQPRMRQASPPKPRRHAKAKKMQWPQPTWQHR